MKRWVRFLVGALFLGCDLVLAGFVYSRLDPGAANAALRRLHLAQHSSSTTTPRRAYSPSLLPGNVSPRGELFGVENASWKVDKWHPRTRVEMGVGDGFTWPDQRNSRQQYLVMTVYEANHADTLVHFASRSRDFHLHGSDNASYSEAQTVSSVYKGPQMREYKDLRPGEKNVGGIAFHIPIRRGTYTVLWKESTLARWLPVAKVTVGPGHKPIVSPSS